MSLEPLEMISSKKLSPKKVLHYDHGKREDILVDGNDFKDEVFLDMREYSGIFLHIHNTGDRRLRYEILSNIEESDTPPDNEETWFEIENGSGVVRDGSAKIFTIKDHWSWLKVRLRKIGQQETTANIVIRAYQD